MAGAPPGRGVRGAVPTALAQINERKAHQGKVVTVRPPTLLAQVRRSLCCQQRQVANLLADCCTLGLHCVTITRQ